MINDLFVGMAALAQTAGSLAIYLAAGILPCFLWLLFYLARDRHPEPKKEIVWVFVLGALMTAPAVALEVFLTNIMEGIGLSYYVFYLLYYIVAIGFVEEAAKYLAVWAKEQANNQNRELDEPADFAIYMITAALGFAAMENLLVLFGAAQDKQIDISNLLIAGGSLPLVMVAFFRGFNAILLHALASGIMGYFMALSFCQREKKTGLLLGGLLAVSALHGLYDFFMHIANESEANLPISLFSLIIILSMAISLYIMFKKLLKMKSVCIGSVKRKA